MLTAIMLMFTPLIVPLIPLLIAGTALAAGGAAGGAIGAAANRRKAKKEESRAYGEAKEFLDSQYYRDPTTTPGNRALLKTMDERLRKDNEAIDNRAEAGGATTENRLAARQASNETMSGTYARLLQGEDERRDRVARQRMQLDLQHSANIQGQYLQAAQDWQAWGTALGNAGMQLGSAGLLAKQE
jgi:hypothetical protein